MERILDKINKLKELVERGEAGEALNAKRVLERICKLHNIDLEQLFEEKKKRYEFKIRYNDTFDKQLLFQCYAKVTNKDTISYFSNKSRSNVIKFELTNIEYIDLKGMFDFYRKEWNKIKKSSLKDLFDAFVFKNQISHNQENNIDISSITSEEWEKILRIQKIMSQIETNPYYKQLE